MLFDKLKQDRIQAMKERNYIIKDLLGTLIGECSKETKEPTDDKVIATIKKFIKNTEECLKYISDSDKLNPLCKEMNELIILESYLPKQMTEEEIRGNIELLKLAGNTNIGMIMKSFKDLYENEYDGATVSRIAKELL